MRNSSNGAARGNNRESQFQIPDQDPNDSDNSSQILELWLPSFCVPYLTSPYWLVISLLETDIDPPFQQSGGLVTSSFVGSLCYCFM